MDKLPRSPSLPTNVKVLTVATRVLLWLVVLAWLVFGAAWATLHLFIVPRIGELRPVLETRASQLLGLPVRIGAIVARADSLFPSFEFQNLQLLDRAGRSALQLPRVTATLSPRSLWNLGFEQLVIERPELDIRRAADGRLHVAGIEIPQQSAGDGRAADWLFSQTEWLVRGGRVQWHDELRAAPPLQLHDVELRMRNGVRSHDLRVDATPPPELGGRFSLRGRFTQPLLFGRPGEWQRWQGQVYAVFERVDIQQLQRHLPLPLEVAGGRGTLRTWVDVLPGQVSGVTADVALAELSLRLGAQLPSLDLSRLSGRLGGRALEGGFEAYTQGLKFDTVDGLHWHGGDVRVSYADPGQGTAVRGEIRANRIDLAILAQLAQRLPLGARVHEALLQYAPKGEVEVLQGRWQGPWEAPERFDARGRLSRLEVGARAQLQPLAEGAPPPGTLGSPGVRGLTVDFDLTQDGGRASVLVQQGHLELPGVFEQPRVALDQLSADLQWRQQGGQTSLQVNNARLANPDLQGEFQLNWQTAAAAGARLPGVLDLQGSLSRAELSALHRYLPQAISPQVRDYLRQALSQGWAGGARFRVKGDLREFPFSRPGQGDFRITANLNEARFAYVPAGVQPAQLPTWPALTDLRGDLLIDHSSLQLRNVNARLDGAEQLRISQGEARIPDLGKDPRVLTNLQIGGPLDELLRGLIVASPLDDMLGGLLTQARGNGPAEVQLRLDLPLQKLASSQVQGQIKLAGNELQLAPGVPRLTRARGTLHFSERGFALAGLQGRLLGGDLRAEGGTIAIPGSKADGPPRLRVQGNVTALGLRQETQLGAVARLAQQMAGSTAYTAEFGMVQGLPELQLNTSLQGLALNLPAPLNKTAEVALPLHLQLTPARSESPEASSGPRLDLLRLDLGNLLALRYVREHSEDATRVVRGTVGVGLPAGETLPMPDEGVVASVQFEALDLDAWRVLAAPPAGTAAAPTGGAPVPALLQPYLPTSLVALGSSLRVGGQTFRQLVAGGTREDQIWRINLDARELSGYLEYRMPGEIGAGYVYARLARLVLAQENASGVERLLDEQPVGIPALDVVINNLELRGKNLGRVEVEAINRGLAARDTGAREWRLSRLQISMPEAQFTASGNWAVYQEASEPTGRVTVLGPPPAPAAPAPRGERRRTVMNFKLDVSDAGGLLQRLGMPGLIRAGKGQMEGQASWLGSPLGLDYPSLGGSFNVNIEDGQFLKAEPGIAKLMGVLSLQALPRRLALDFRDVFSDGFSFDFFRGDIQIEQGMASTNNLQMKGVNAAVLMSGRADLARETQDLRVVVVPEINAGTASLIATVINPAVGLGTFLAQWLVRKPAIAAATQEFRITGSWTEPQMSKVQTPVPAPAHPEGTPP